MANDKQVLFHRSADLGVITLNRPQALNSLNDAMVTMLMKQYKQWNEDRSVHAILIKGSGGKAFCAGGDVKFTVMEMRAGRKHIAKSFFRREYELNHYVGHLAKPNIAFIDGIIMGGGAGVSMHGPFRIATERTVFAMPEVGIGLVPDVGASHFLQGLPGLLGTYLALTGTRLKGIQVVEAGLATHLVSSSKLPHLEEELQKLGPRAGDARQLEHLFSTFQAQSGEHTQPSGLLGELASINECFAFDDVLSIVDSVDGREVMWAEAAMKQLLAGSPLSEKLTLRLMREGQGKSLATCLRKEYRVVSHIVDGPSDFEEGIRALLIDKDGKPRWYPASLTEVSEELVTKFFEPLEENEELQFHAFQESKSRL